MNCYIVFGFPVFHPTRYFLFVSLYSLHLETRKCPNHLSLMSDAGTSCTQCKDFKTILVNFRQKYGGNGMEVYTSHIKRVLAQRFTVIISVSCRESCDIPVDTCVIRIAAAHVVSLRLVDRMMMTEIACLFIVVIAWGRLWSGMFDKSTSKLYRLRRNLNNRASLAQTGSCDLKWAKETQVSERWWNRCSGRDLGQGWSWWVRSFRPM